MFFTPPLSKRFMAEKEEQRPSPFIPTVYEHVEVKPIAWEYHLLSIDTAEQALPDAPTLNDLGQQGWILAGMHSEPRSGKKEIVHYYFLRQVDK
jgi:hypothetical protein